MGYVGIGEFGAEWAVNEGGLDFVVQLRNAAFKTNQLADSLLEFRNQI